VKLLLHFKNEIEINKEIEVKIGETDDGQHAILQSKEDSKIVASCMITTRP
jgi:hypothetical protein